MNCAFKSKWQNIADSLNEEFGGKTIKHCMFLNGDSFAIIPNELKTCGSATHKLGPPTICSLYDSLLSPEKFYEGLRGIIISNQTESGPCYGCNFLIKTKINKNFIPKKIKAISIHDFCGCNAKCIYCHGSEYELPEKYISVSDHMKLFNNLLENDLISRGRTTVFWGGGEPTLLTSFSDTANFLMKNGINQVINTSGIFFSQSIESALKEKLATVRVSVDSGSREKFKEIKGSLEYDAVWETISKYVKTGGNLILKYIIMDKNSEIIEIEEFVDRCHIHNVKTICISVDIRSVYSSSEIRTGKITEKEINAAASMYILSKKRNIYPYFETIWPLDLIAKIEAKGSFNSKMNIFSRLLFEIKRNGIRNVYHKIKNSTFLSN